MLGDPWVLTPCRMGGGEGKRQYPKDPVGMKGGEGLGRRHNATAVAGTDLGGGSRDHSNGSLPSPVLGDFQAGTSPGSVPQGWEGETAIGLKRQFYPQWAFIPIKLSTTDSRVLCGQQRCCCGEGTSSGNNGLWWCGWAGVGWSAVADPGCLQALLLHRPS